MRVDMLSPDAYLDWIVGAAVAGRSAYCCVAAVHTCMYARRNPDFRDMIEEADLLIPDSVVLQRSLAWKFGISAPPVMRGAEIMWELCRRAEKNDVSIALVGGRDEAALNQLQRKLRESFPRLEIAFAFSPPFREQNPCEKESLVAAISGSGAQLVFVGLGCPKQERWMSDNRHLLNVTMVGVGAAFDFNSGAVRLSPVWVHQAGFEWLYRLISEPRRLWRRYLSTAPRFLALVALEKLGIGRRPSSRS